MHILSTNAVPATIAASIEIAAEQGLREVAFELDRQARTLWGNDWKFDLEIAKALSRNHAFARKAAQIRADVMQAKLESCNSADDWADALSAHPELRMLAQQFLEEQYIEFLDEQSGLLMQD